MREEKFIKGFLGWLFILILVSLLSETIAIVIAILLVALEISLIRMTITKEDNE